LRYLKTIRPELELEPTKSDSEEIKDVPTTNKLSAVDGVLVIPKKYRKRTGETTDWETVMDFFIDKGMTVEGAAGIAGNMQVESNFKPDVYGDNGTSIGLAQWHNTRMAGLFKFAKDKNLDALAVDTQLEWCWEELTTKFKSLLNSLMTANDPAKAAEDFARKYERPAVISPTRISNAVYYAENYSSVENNIKQGATDIASKVSSGMTKLASLVGLGTTAKATSNVKLSSSDTYGFPTGKVDSGKVVAGGDGGNWAGSMGRALAFAKVAKEFTGKNIIVSQKRSRVTTASGNTSDHYEGSADTYAVDLAASGAKGDELLAHLMKWFGHTEYKGGSWFNVNKDGYRYQIGWRVKDHFDHIHVGVKKL
jgi:hypothetical protein